MVPKILLGHREIGEETKPYLIAEIGVNHEGSLKTAKRLIELAKEGGADAAKFQTYKAKTLASRQSPSYWDLTKEPTTSQFQLFKKYDRFTAKDYRKLAEHCEKVGIDFLSTPFDAEAADFLDPLVPLFKIASADITNYPLLRKVASKRKPIILSTGASTLREIRSAVEILEKEGCVELVLMHCILNYPTADENANLNMIEALKAAFPEQLIGYSDHTLPDTSMTVLTTAYLKGARVLEKHFTHDKKLLGNDHYHAMDVEDLKILRKQIKKILLLEGNREKRVLPSEEISRFNARRSVVLSRPVKAGTILMEEMLVPKRPGTGISPTHWSEIVGMVTTRDLEEDHPLHWSDVEMPQKARKPKVVAVIQARMGSQRLPGKMMANLSGVPVIEWVLTRVSSTQRVDEVLLALPRGERDDALADIAHEKNIKVFRGSEEDVLDRLVQAARETAADTVIRVCADNPFIDAHEIDRLIEFYLHERPDYAFNHLNRMGNNYPDGLGAEILSRRLLEDVDEKAILKKHREHVTLYLWDHSDWYSLKTFPATPHLTKPDVRLDIDTPEDLQRLESILARIRKGTNTDICPESLKAETILEFATA